MGAMRHGGMLESRIEFGGAVDLAVVGSVGATVYRGQIFEAVPADVPNGAADAARENLPPPSRWPESYPSREEPV